ncbi:MAG: carbohydrate-binding family 9-like protein [Acidobacteriota bacterium]
MPDPFLPYIGEDMHIPILLLFATAANTGVIVSHYSNTDFELTADPNARPWKGVQGVIAENDSLGKPVAGHRTEIRSRWTNRNLYLLYICPYEELHLRAAPSTTTETNKLWEWDVAEAFIGANFQNIRQYKEFQVSPQGEWVDLDIDRDKPKPEGGWVWNSGFKVKARIDAAARIWYGEMQIPIEAIDARPPRDGLEMRINLYRCQARPPARKFIAWQPTGQRSFHVPEAFGLLRLKK